MDLRTGILAVALLAACGGGGGGTVRITVDLAGNWTVAQADTSLEPSCNDCFVYGITVQQAGNRLTVTSPDFQFTATLSSDTRATAAPFSFPAAGGGTITVTSLVLLFTGDASFTGTATWSRTSPSCTGTSELQATKGGLPDLAVLQTSPLPGDTLRNEDSLDGFNALNQAGLANPGAVTATFTTTLDPDTILDPAATDGLRNAAFLFFDEVADAFERVAATAVLASANGAKSALVIRPQGLSPANPLREGLYNVRIEPGVRNADGDGLGTATFCLSFHVGPDTHGPRILDVSPTPGEQGVDPFAEIRVRVTEAILAPSIANAIDVTYTPPGGGAPVPVQGSWFTDGGNRPGNNFPALQLDGDGLPGRSGVSPRNGLDLVFVPDVTGFPRAMTAEDPNDPACTLLSDPPSKGNFGFPAGSVIDVTVLTGPGGPRDLANNTLDPTSPFLAWSFEIAAGPATIHAPGTTGALYYADTTGVGVIDVDPARTGYVPTPPRQPNSVVMRGAGPARVAVPDVVDLATDARVYTSFYSFVCTPGMLPRIFHANVYSLSASQQGGEVVVVDAYTMLPLGRFRTPSPGGLCLTGFGNDACLAVTNFSTNTATVFDISDVAWFTGPTLPQGQAGLEQLVDDQLSTLILREADFGRVFPNQRPGGPPAPPGPPIRGTITTGLGPTACAVTGAPNSMGLTDQGCQSPILDPNLILCVVNSGASTADFTELARLDPDSAIAPDRAGVGLAGVPTDVAWTPFSQASRAAYFFIPTAADTVDIFATGAFAGSPSVRPGTATNAAPNAVVASVSGFTRPTGVQWIPRGAGLDLNNGYSLSVLVAETGANQVRQLSVTVESPFTTVVGPALVAGLGPVAVTGDPAGAGFVVPCSPEFFTYFVANAGSQTILGARYDVGVQPALVPIPSVLGVASWWSR